MKNTLKNIIGLLKSRIYWLMLWIWFPLTMMGQSYEQLWKDVEIAQQKDLPRSSIQLLEQIYTKATYDKNVPQFMKAQLTMAMEQVKLTPDSAEVEVKKLKVWAESEKNPVTAALLYHLLGNIEMQRNEPNWIVAIEEYKKALKERSLLLRYSAEVYAPLIHMTDFSRRFFQDNLYDMLVRQTIVGLMSNWEWTRNVDVQRYIVSLYDSLIDTYGVNGMMNPTAAVLSHESKIIFLSKEVLADEFHLSKKQAEQSLRDLLRLYDSDKMKAADDALVDVSLKLAEVLCDQQKLVEAMEVLKEAQKKYPNSSQNLDLQRKMDWINVPFLSMSIPLVYPKFQGKLVVNYKNITGVVVEMYRLRLSPDAPELNGNVSNEVLCRTYGRKVWAQRFMLPNTSDYRSHIETLTLQLPEEGIYVVKAMPVGRKGKADYQLMYVSPYQCLFVPLLDGRTEVMVVDCISGHPVPFAEVVGYQAADRNRFVPSQVWKTNNQGSVIVRFPSHGATYINARTPGHDFMKIAYVYRRSDYWNKKGQELRMLTSLFTDRSLYRPGQVVHVSGVRYKQLSDSLHTVPGEVMKVELFDVNGKKVSEASAMTDLFGVFAVDFTLPRKLLSGQFTLRTEGETLGIRVENYKRPTFDVTFDPIKETYTFDDMVKLSGVVQTFAGAPVRLARGTYKMVRSEAWMWRRGGDESHLTSGSFTTDAQGKFTMNVVLDSPSNKKALELVPYYNYVVTVTVTDGAGETQEAMLTLPVGKRSLGLQIQGLQSKLVREQQEKIQFQVMNLKKQLVETEVNYKVYSLSPQHELKDKDEAACVDRGVSQFTQTSESKLVVSGKAMSQTAFVPSEVYTLPAGRYQIKASVRDDQGRLVEVSQEFVLFSLSDKQPPVHITQWFYQDGASWEDGKPITLYVGSSEKQVYMLMDVYTGRKRIRSERFWLNNSIRRFEFAFDEKYGDGLVVSFAFVREGKLYTKTVRMEKPRPRKHLTLRWESFRDKLTPGQQEMWTLKITNHLGNSVNANLLATLYDASLDKLYPHKWWMQPYFSRWLPYVNLRLSDSNRRCGLSIDFPYQPNVAGYDLLSRDTYSHLPLFFIWNRPNYINTTTRAYASPMVALKSTSIPLYDVTNDASYENDFVINVEEKTAETEELSLEERISTTDMDLQQSLRKSFAETAFYYPTLRTDEKGEVSISFTLPDALTEWKFMGLAHTQALDCGAVVSKVKSSKPFMVQPNMPRFVRVGDASSLAVSLVNLSMETVEGKVRIELVNPVNNQVVFKQVRDFKVDEGVTSVLQFNYTVSDNYDVLVYRVMAEAGEFSDGEQHYLPVLTNKKWITETIPFQVEGNEGKYVTLKHLFNNQSRTAIGKRLTIELTANPNWYVIQALSVVSNPVHEDAVSWATAYYANALAMYLVHSNPHIQQVFEKWMAEGVTKETLWSKLEANADLKQVLLEETPWLVEAQTETEQKNRIAVLFELNTMIQRLSIAEQQLKRLQTAEGGWTWYPGMPVNRHTTTQIVELLARLQTKGVQLNSQMKEVYLRGLNYLKREVQKEQESYLNLQRDNKESIAHWAPSTQAVRYLYICSIDKLADQMADKKVNTFFVDSFLHEGLIQQSKQSFSMYQKALLAIIFQAYGYFEQAGEMLQSLKEYLVSTPFMGCYFDTFKAAYSWNGYRIPTHVAAMEAIYQVCPDMALLEQMKLWLLKQKQVQQWDTPLTTMDAIYAFLLEDASVKTTHVLGEDEKQHVEGLISDGIIRAKVGNEEVVTPNDALGYRRVTITDNALLTPKRNASLWVEKNGSGLGWGAVYAQCLENMDNIHKSANKGLSVNREYRVNGKLVTPTMQLHVGETVSIRLIVKNDRDMDFVSIKDSRAACLEPVDQLSGYEWTNGLNLYRIHKDASTTYFIDKLPKGTHVLEYTAFVSRTGSYQAGTAVVQSVYAPEFTAHSKSVVLNIEK